jgi:hypothetical protein
MAGKTANKSTPSTQKYIDIAEIKEDVVVMKDGTLRAVLLVSSINFALKAQEEQDALIAGYMDFLNSFKYPFQIVIQSRKLNMDQYLGSLRVLEKNQTNELLKGQMASYREYVRELVEIGEIMTKRFFVVVPYSPGTEDGKRKSWFQKFQEVFTPGQVIKISRKSFEEYSRELGIRVDQVIGQLGSMGLQSVRLDTQSLIELYYNAYNPSTSESQQLGDLNEIQITE